jgi:hypothetical protein
MLSFINATSPEVLVGAISYPRLQSYRSFFNARSDSEALGIYEWNDAISGALFRVISLVEIVLRNQFHRTLSSVHGQMGNASSRDWYLYLQLPRESKQKVQKLLERNQRGSKASRVSKTSPDDVISKLTLGFWTHLIDVRTTIAGLVVDWSTMLPVILPGHRQKASTYWSRQASQDALIARLDLINNLRNRIAHHEPIWKLGALMEESRPRLHFKPKLVEASPRTPSESLARLRLLYNKLVELLGWLCPGLATAFEGSEADVRCQMLLTERTLDHYRNRQPTGRLQIATFANDRRLRSLLERAASRRQPLALLIGPMVVGHWTSLPA